MRRVCLRFIVLVACSRYGMDAHAQSPGDEAIGLALFAEGRVLAAKDDFVHACQKFEGARSWAPWLGIDLNLADCYEHLGRTASAWVLFRKASDDAEKLADPRARYARERADKLEPVLSHVVIEPDPASTGVEIRLDRKLVPPAALRVPLPVDPGEHLVEAVAAGNHSWATRATVDPGALVNVAVPRLAAERSPPVEPIRATRPRRARSWLALSLGGAGVVVVASSLLLGLDAKLRYDEALRGPCDAHLSCDSQGYAAIREARSRGDLATLVGGAGIATIGAAVIVYLRAPRDEDARTTVVPVVTPTMVGVSVQGSL